MTTLFQELLFVNAVEDFKQEDLVKFSILPQDIQLSNVLINQYEYAWFKTNIKNTHRRVSTYLLALPNNKVTRIVTVFETKIKDEREATRAELTTPEKVNVRNYAVGRSIVAEDDILKSLEGEEEGGNIDASQEKNNHDDEKENDTNEKESNSEK